MAESVVSVAINTIADLLIREARSLYGVKDDVERLQAELKRMQSFLRDADDRQEEGNERFRNFVAQIKDIAYDAEDIIETFVVKVSRRQYGTSVFNRFICTITGASHLHNMGAEIKSLRTKLEDISKGMQIFGVNFSEEGEGSRSANEMRRQLRRTYPHEEEEHLFSVQSRTHDLMVELMKDEDRLCVVSLVGMGGLGKTTLARKVYIHSDMRQHFDCHCWAFISQKFSPRDVLLEILRPFVTSKEDREKLEKMKAEEMVTALFDELKNRRYLVVLDDIWNVEAWDFLRPAFPKGKKGSKVLFTTRIKDVALYADPRSSPIEPPLLTDQESWSLLNKKAFARDVDKHNIPPEFEKLGKEMVKKCGGLPLAIVVLGGMLATKKSLLEWEKVQRNINSQYAAGVHGILALSYQALPFYLKPCFLYLSQFLEDSEIHKRQIIRMWIAEGFISQPSYGDEMTMEDVGEQYLEELANRCMVQVSKQDHTGIGVKTFRIHDLMREMCVSKASQQNFLKVISANQTNTPSPSISNSPASSTNSRRIAIHCHKVEGSYQHSYPPMVQGNSHIRSLVYFVDEQGTLDYVPRCLMCGIPRAYFWIPFGGYWMTRKHVEFISKNFRLLRVLNLQFVQFYAGRLPKEIGTLIYLRYFGLRNCYMRRVPASIGNMKSLYTLDLRHNWYYDEMDNIPDVMWKLRSLRHLLLGGFSDDSATHLRVDTLKNLETLKDIHAASLTRNQALRNLTNLRNLGVILKRTEQVEEILNCPFFKLDGLRSLDMRPLNYEDINYRSLEPLSHCHHLTKLRLQGRIQEDVASLQHNLEFLPASLAKLTLERSKLQRDPMGILEKLHNLKSLTMDDSFSGSQITCSVRGFPQLEFLQLQGLRDLEEWRVEEGAMPCLRTLIISWLPKLRMIPEGIKFVTTLRELTLYFQSREFTERIQVINGVEGEDFYKIRHIPSISVI